MHCTRKSGELMIRQELKDTHYLEQVLVYGGWLLGLADVPAGSCPAQQLQCLHHRDVRQGTSQLKGVKKIMTPGQAKSHIHSTDFNKQARTPYPQRALPVSC